MKISPLFCSLLFSIVMLSLFIQKAGADPYTHPSIKHHSSATHHSAVHQRVSYQPLQNHSSKELASKAFIKQVIEETLLENPEIVEKALSSLQKKREYSLRKKRMNLVKEHETRIYNDKAYPVLGNAQAPHTVVLFIDYQCGFCHHMLQDMMQYTQEHGDVRVLVRELTFVSPLSQPLAELALQAQSAQKYPDFLKIMFGENVPSEEAALSAMREKLQLPALGGEQLQEIRKALAETKTLAEDLNINSTPTFIVGALIYEDYHSKDSFDRLLTKRLRNGSSLSDKRDEESEEVPTAVETVQPKDR